MLKIMSPVEKTIKLASDEAQEAFVVVRQATQGDVDSIEDLRSSGTEYSYSDAEWGQTRVKPSKGTAEIRRRQVYLTLCESNIQDENGNELFKTTMVNGHKRMADVVSFERAWALLDPALAAEIYQAVLSVNPQWKLSLGE